LYPRVAEGRYKELATFTVAEDATIKGAFHLKNPNETGYTYCNDGSMVGGWGSVWLTKS